MKNELTIELVPWSQLESQEVRHVQQLFSSEGISINVSSSVYVRKAAEVPPIIQIVIVAPFVWFAKGFFTRMGEDTWEGLKRGLKKSHSYLRGRYKQDPDKELCFRHEERRIRISLPRENEERLSEALGKLPEYLEHRTGDETWIVYDEEAHEWHEMGH